ncbi:MAG: peptide-methionine (S)-S-oxide reductase MsrA [Candidatus Dadabacteria bacterium]|nr:peptide-methionine (S)-S-oxide reductase MsrA [Candidatus Dadabacteria bacterium]NIQ15781.1 peptide-methionine (S)-S-oxide reductase MsrA [Candidatus Dadabacteria bacterium]
MFKIIKLLLLVILVFSVTWTVNNLSSKEYSKKEEKELKMTDINNNYEKATFAGGCFWCMQPPFDRLEGVVKTTVGYSGGLEINPTYHEVASGRTSHAEAIEVIFDSEKISYEKLLETFWMNIDPTQANGQFADRGSQYRTAIFYHSEDQKEKALASKKKLEESGKFKDPIVTIIEPFKSFYVAEEYHQKYYQKNPVHYNGYKKGSGREGYIKKTWGN